MKKYIFTLLIIITAARVSAQSDPIYNYSIGISGFSNMQMPKILNQTNGNNSLNSYFSNYIVKFNDNQISYRLSGSYLKKSTDFYNNCENCEQVNGQLKDFSFKVGFEKNFSYSIIQPYFAFDVGYRSNKFNGISTNINPQRNADAALNNAVIPTDKIIATKEGFTVTPVIGVKFNPVKYISVFVESNLEFFYSYERQESVTQDVTNYRTLNRFHKTEYLINPVSAGIQIHLGVKN